MSAVVRPASGNPRLKISRLVQLLVERQRLAAERERTAAAAAGLDQWARMACENPAACSCPEDYPNWTPGGAS